MVADILGCENQHNFSVAAKIDIDIAVNHDPCAACKDGQVTASVSGIGKPPFTYRWNDSDEQTSATATGLAPGKYIVFVTDADGCFNSDTVRIGIFGVNQFYHSNAVLVYMNHSTNELIIERKESDSGPGTFQLFDLTGRLVSDITLKSKKETVNLHNIILENGIYYYSLSEKNKLIRTGKLFIAVE